jgi:hypothetical protein
MPSFCRTQGCPALPFQILPGHWPTWIASRRYQISMPDRTVSTSASPRHCWNWRLIVPKSVAGMMRSIGGRHCSFSVTRCQLILAQHCLPRRWLVLRGFVRPKLQACRRASTLGLPRKQGADQRRPRVRALLCTNRNPTRARRPQKG